MFDEDVGEGDDEVEEGAEGSAAGGVCAAGEDADEDVDVDDEDEEGAEDPEAGGVCVAGGDADEEVDVDNKDEEGVEEPAVGGVRAVGGDEDEGDVEAVLSWRCAAALSGLAAG